MASDSSKDGDRKKEEPRVGSIAAAIAVLRHLSQIDGGQGVNAIARELGLNQSSCFNILKTLAAEKFVSFDPVSKLYSLGFGPIMLARRALDPANAFDHVRYQIDSAARAHDLTIGLWRLTSNPERMLLIGHSESDAPTRIQLSNGLRIPRMAGAMGRIVAAVRQMSRAQIAEEFAPLIWDDAPTLDNFLADVDHARVHMWAIDRDNYARGVTSLAVPVFDGTGALRYCLSLTMFSGRAQSIESFVDFARELAQDVGERLFGVVSEHHVVGARR